MKTTRKHWAAHWNVGHQMGHGTMFTENSAEFLPDSALVHVLLPKLETSQGLVKLSLS